MWSPKRVFPLQQNTNRWKILVANFFFRNWNEENTFGAATAIFPITKRLAIENHDVTKNCGVTCVTLKIRERVNFVWNLLVYLIGAVSS